MQDHSVDIDVQTGGNISGWPHVVQCIETIFATTFGERVMREWFGSAVPRLLGEKLTTSTVVRFWSAVVSALEIWEPRFHVTQIVPVSVGRDGELNLRLEGQYRPRALYGDMTAQGGRVLRIAEGSSGRPEVINV